MQYYFAGRKRFFPFNNALKSADLLRCVKPEWRPWSQRAVWRPSLWSHDGALISKWVKWHNCDNIKIAKSFFTWQVLQYRRTFSEQKKKALWKNNLTFSSRISIKQNQTRLNSTPTHWYGLDPFVHRKYQLNKNSHDFYEYFKRQRGELRQWVGGTGAYGLSLHRHL